MKKNTGFTMVELIVIIALITILMVIVLGGLNRSRMKARDNVRVAGIQEIRLALEEYRARCGVFPESLDADTDNARTGTCQTTLGEIISVIPTAPERPNASLLSSSTAPSGTYVNGFLYSGLSTDINGPCYDYHIGVELEYAEDNGQDKSSYLNEDHDFEKGEGQYDERCGAALDFGSNNILDDDEKGLYDFRSVNNK